MWCIDTLCVLCMCVCLLCYHLLKSIWCLLLKSIPMRKEVKINTTTINTHTHIRTHGTKIAWHANISTLYACVMTATLQNFVCNRSCVMRQKSYLCSPSCCCDISTFQKCSTKFLLVSCLSSWSSSIQINIFSTIVKVAVLIFICKNRESFKNKNLRTHVMSMVFTRTFHTNGSCCRKHIEIETIQTYIYMKKKNNTSSKNANWHHCNVFRY